MKQHYLNSPMTCLSCFEQSVCQDSSHCLKHPYGQKKKKNPKEFYQNLKGSNQMSSEYTFLFDL